MMQLRLRVSVLCLSAFLLTGSVSLTAWAGDGQAEDGQATAQAKAEWEKLRPKLTPRADFEFPADAPSGFFEFTGRMLRVKGVGWYVGDIAARNELWLLVFMDRKNGDAIIHYATDFSEWGTGPPRFKETSRGDLVYETEVRVTGTGVAVTLFTVSVGPQRLPSGDFAPPRLLFAGYSDGYCPFVADDGGSKALSKYFGRAARRLPVHDTYLEYDLQYSATLSRDGSAVEISRAGYLRVYTSQPVEEIIGTTPAELRRKIAERFKVKVTGATLTPEI